MGGLLFETGLANLVGRNLFQWTEFPWLFVGILVFFTIFLTETISNTATAALLVPLAISASQGVALDPLIPSLGVAVACSFAFMMPVATPPNAIMYGSGKVRIMQMAKLGLGMNIACGTAILLWLAAIRFFF